MVKQILDLNKFSNHLPIVKSEEEAINDFQQEDKKNINSNPSVLNNKMQWA